MWSLGKVFEFPSRLCSATCCVELIWGARYRTDQLMSLRSVIIPKSWRGPVLSWEPILVSSLTLLTALGFGWVGIASYRLWGCTVWIRTGFQVHTTRRYDPVGYVCVVFPVDVRHGLLCQCPYCGVVNDCIVRIRLSDCIFLTFPANAC